ncbi:MAG: Rrf2 family transcriptional regulator [Alphaproteobacteria bacterium]|nr:Rrf2 family transcriptional regulator [Alphaproteobacteria bacterium]
MRLTSKGRYAVMAMADLAMEGGALRAVPLQDIAQRQQISLSYLEQLFARLRRAELVAGVRGPGGGYRLGRSPDAIPIAAIVAAVNEPIQATRCKSGGRGCMAKGARCVTHELWDDLGRTIAAYLATVSLADVVEGRIGDAQPDMVAAE